MIQNISPSLLISSLVAIIILMLNMHIFVMVRRRNILSKLFKLIRDKEINNHRTDKEASEVIEILFTNKTPIFYPVYIFTETDEETDLLIISLLRAVLRHLRLNIEMEMHEQGYLNMGSGGKKQFDIGLRFLQKVEEGVDYMNLTRFEKIKKLMSEYMNGMRMHYLLLKVNGKKFPKIKPVFRIAQKTRKDPREIIFPIAYESVPKYSLI